MYYILRYGYEGKPIKEREYHKEKRAKSAFKIVSNLYDRLQNEGLIHHYTCLLITKGVRYNEETESIEHGSREGQSN